MKGIGTILNTNIDISEEFSLQLLDTGVAIAVNINSDFQLLNNYLSKLIE